MIPGYESFVGQVRFAYPERNELELRYRFCSSGHGEYIKCLRHIDEGM
jgi:hypothetical protein